MLKFQFCQLIGQGQFSKVMLAKNSGHSYALKVIDKLKIQKCNLNQQVQREIDIQSKLKHKNIVQLFTHFQDNQKIYLVTEYCEKGSLYQKQFTKSKIKEITKQILTAIQYIHQMGIMHRDIKPENIYLTQDDVVKIGDFGCSIQKGKRRKTFCGTLDYMSPEIILSSSIMSQYDGYDERVDIWAIGILLFELFNNTVPFRDINKYKQQDRICREEIVFKKGEDPLLIDFVQCCLHKDPNQRANLQQLLEHPFLQF
ncbi:unnamed protein product (macronuclear) [Paramecium tetraurelia]|uniref:Protein kinase domain-containing protein n=1 Tax=Paramecium tetraurelia TaxID=5888 RepID=A0BZH8_PARTE|nr:uncharacterized protein GSPATT00033798001 [Paramecium tetraurelia]CAK63945.1 unnamed protein product [Paramecium tetraurelia]|eukprot:XP_001431343.1 hypothetical protein (macronuclear) [Paramecium tetraurelia strain d4-2]